MYVHSMEHRAVRLLSKCYDLTAVGYKFLEIGINVDPPRTCNGLYEQRWNIYKMLRNEYKDNFISDNFLDC